MTTTEPPKSQVDSELRRREWLRIYVPILVGAVLCLAAVVLSGIVGYGQANGRGNPVSVWGDTAALLVMVQVAAVCVIPLALLIALCAATVWLIARLHPPLQRGREITEQIHNRVDGLGDSVVSAVTRLHLPGARFSALKQWLRR